MMGSRTVFMGMGDTILSCRQHEKLGTLICFNKAKNKVLPTEDESTLVKTKMGKEICQIYFPNKESMKTLIDYLQMVHDNWENEE